MKREFHEILLNAGAIVIAYACDSFGKLKQDFLDFIRMIQQ
jgi:hypothetical protein